MIQRLLLTMSICLGLGLANPVTFTSLPASGDITALPSSTVGWGYAISNQTAYWLLPFGLSNSGVVNGSLDDIFDYPIVDPGQTITQDYAFNLPGGFGNSLGLYEYAVPSSALPGFIESGTFTLTYQLYTANPDLNSDATAVGGMVDVAAPFSTTITEATPYTSVPEPGTAGILSVGSVLLVLRWRRRRDPVRDHRKAERVE